jgi:cysteine desulfurase / selenocysteine lyase
MNFRDDFPILKQNVNGHPLVYFDNAATSHKPKAVIDCLNDYYSTTNSNVHRGVHELSQKATHAYETSRKIAQSFIGANSSKEIVFTKGTTDGINTVARSWAANALTKNDEILITAMEHHSNIVPWQMICDLTGATLKVAPISQNGELDLNEFNKLITPRTKLVAITHVSNTLGTINPIKEIISIAKNNGSKTLVDAAQSVPHFTVNVEDLECDFLVFSGHKIFGPTGVGVLYVREQNYKDMQPFVGGGDMIKKVTFKKTTYNDPPYLFEAGTPNIAGVIGLSAALSYVQSIGMEKINSMEEELLDYATEKINNLEGIRIIGQAAKKASVISFIADGSHPFDIGTILDQMGIAIRTGHHCTQPLMDFYKISGTARASFAFYNTKEEIDYFIKSLDKAIRMLN